MSIVLKVPYLAADDIAKFDVGVCIQYTPNSDTDLKTE